MQEYGDVIPVPGPKLFRDDSWSYTNAINDELNQFIGTEEIRRGTELVYRAHYHGGFIA